MLSEMITAAIFSYVGYQVDRQLNRTKYEIHIGEQKVNQAFKEHLSMSDYRLLENVTLATGDGSTTQIDHVVVSPFGIFVIETKHYAGLVVGTERQKNWTQITRTKKRKFQNPINQNYKHLKELQTLLPELDRQCFHSLIVFSGNARFQHHMPSNVIQSDDIAQYVRQFDINYLSTNDMILALGRIQLMRKEESLVTDNDHVKGLKRKFS